MKIQDTPAYCPRCGKLRANDREVENCMFNDNVTSEERGQPTAQELIE